MITLKEYTQLCEDRDTARDSCSRIEGSIRAQIKELTKEFSCDTLQEAEKIQEKLQREIAELEKEYRELETEYKEDWPQISD